MTDVVVIGGGQSGLATGYFLQRAGVDFRVLDAQEGPGGAWRHAWPSLTLFSPGAYSSLPGWMFPPTRGAYPTRDEALDYLAKWEARYALPIERPVRVTAVRAAGDTLRVEAADGRAWDARAVVMATGSWDAPFVPEVPGRAAFRGTQTHSAHYAGPEAFVGQRVAVIGGGNSGAQLLAELSLVAEVTWCTERPPAFLPDDVDGRYLFHLATQRWHAKKDGLPDKAPPSLGDVVMVAPVKDARARGVLVSAGTLARVTERGIVLGSGEKRAVDAIVWCTGFRPALTPLAPLGVVDARGRVEVAGMRSVAEPRLWLVGYGEWTGFGSATLIGVQRYAKAAAAEIAASLGKG